MKSEQKLNLVENQPEHTRALGTGLALRVLAPWAKPCFGAIHPLTKFKKNLVF